MSEKTENNNTFLEALKVILRYRWLFLVSACVGAIMILLVSLAIPLRYTAKAVFESHTDAAVEGTGPSKNETFRVHKMTLRQELAGPKAVMKAFDELGLRFKNKDDKLALARQFSNRIKIRWRVRADRVNLIEVEFTDSNPRLAEAIPNILVKNYIKFISHRIVSRLEESKAFLLEQVAKWNKKVAELKKKDIEYSTRYGMALGDGPKMLRERIEQIEIEIDALKRQKNIVAQRAEYLKRVALASRITSLNNKLRKLRDQLERALTVEHMTRNHPKVLALRKRIERVVYQIEQIRSGKSSEGADSDSMTSSGIMYQLASAEAQVQTITEEIEKLENQLKGYKSVISRAGPVLYRYSQIKEELQYAQHQAVIWQKKLADIETALEGERAKLRTQLKTVQLAKSTDRPLSPRLWTVLIFALAGGFAFGYVFTFGVDSMDNTIRSPEQIAEEFGLPVAGMIEEIVPESQKTLANIKRRTIGFVVGVVLIGMLLLSSGIVVLRLKYPQRYAKVVSLVGVSQQSGNTEG